jgi:hypothetical protein
LLDRARDAAQRPTRRAWPAIVAIGRNVKTAQNVAVCAIAVGVELAFTRRRTRTVAQAGDHTFATGLHAPIGVEMVTKLHTIRKVGARHEAARRKWVATAHQWFAGKHVPCTIHAAHTAIGIVEAVGAERIPKAFVDLAITIVV